MIKLSTTGANLAAKAKLLAPSEESLIEAAEGLSAASEALFEAQMAGEEIVQVMGNLDLALESISQYGLTKQTLGIFNSEGELCACCGMENLTVAGLEAAGAEAEKSLKEKASEMTKKLGAKAKEYWAKFIAWLKNFWAKMVDWFKNLFIFRARMTNAIKAFNFDKAETKAKFNGDTELSVYKQADVKEMMDLVVDLHSKFEMDISAKKDKFDKLEKASGKVSANGWTADSIELIAKLWIGKAEQVAFLKNVQTTTKAELDKLVDEAGKAANGADVDKKAIEDKRTELIRKLANIRYEASLINKIGATLKTLQGAYKKAEEKKEEKK